MSYIGNSPGVASQRIVSTFTATADQTVFTPSSGYTLGYVDVYKNGVKLAPTSFTADNGVTVILGSGAALNDIVEVIAYIPRGLSDWLYEVRTPSNVSPNNGATAIGLNPTLTGSPYYSLYGAAMTAAQWQVSLDQNFLNTVISTGDIAGTSVTYAIPGDALGNLTTYYWRVRYKDANGVYSAWSAPTTFTTEAFTLPAIGAAYGGGYYAGSINIGGIEFLLIVAPKAYGEQYPLSYKTENTSTSGVGSVIDGPGNTASMTANSALRNLHPAATFCANLVTGGYNDWYLPASKELEIIYYNLKPWTNTNHTYNNVNSVDNEVNTFAIPQRLSAYTSTVPGQTSSTAFRYPGGSESMTAFSTYWSSSSHTSITSQAYAKQFIDFSGSSALSGLGYSLNKTNSLAVRAVRRVQRPA